MVAAEIDRSLGKALRKVYAETPLNDVTGPRLVKFLDGMFDGKVEGDEGVVAKTFDDLFDDLGTIRENVRLAFQVEGASLRR